MDATDNPVPWRASADTGPRGATVPEPWIWPFEIRAYREAAGLSQRQLATALGVCVDTVERWEDGRHTPMNEGLLRLALEALLAPSTEYVRAVLLVVSHGPR